MIPIVFLIHLISAIVLLIMELFLQNIEEKGGLYSVCWFRVVLDEAHTIKSSKSQISLAASALTADRRWCLTGTPIQVLPVYSVVHYDLIYA